MSETDSPDEGSGNDTALSYEDGAAAIESLLSNVPEPQDSEQSEESQNDNDDHAAEGDTASQEAPDEGDDGLELDDEALAAEADAPEVKSEPMEFAPKDAKVKLPDGTTTSVAELIAGNMFQRTFTEKTTALAQEKKALEAERGQFAETKQQIEHQRNVILTLAKEMLPQEPQPPSDPEDLVGYLEYTKQRDAYQEKMTKLQTLWNASQQEQAQLTERQKKEQEEAIRSQQEEYENFLKAEYDKLVNAIPRLKDETERKKFREEAVTIGQTVYGIPESEIDAISDHRYLRVYADAMAFRKAIAKRDAAKQSAPVSQPVRIQQRQRMAPQAPQARDQNAATDRLRKTGSLDDAAKALMKFV